MSHSLSNAPEGGLKAPTRGENFGGTSTQNLNNDQLDLPHVRCLRLLN